jgi:hypothetical protein
MYLLRFSLSDSFDLIRSSRDELLFKDPIQHPLLAIFRYRCCLFLDFPKIAFFSRPELVEEKKENFWIVADKYNIR